MTMDYLQDVLKYTRKQKLKRYQFSYMRFLKTHVKKKHEFLMLKDKRKNWKKYLVHTSGLGMEVKIIIYKKTVSHFSRKSYVY